MLVTQSAQWLYVVYRVSSTCRYLDDVINLSCPVSTVKTHATPYPKACNAQVSPLCAVASYTCSTQDDQQVRCKLVLIHVDTDNLTGAIPILNPSADPILSCRFFQ